MRVVIADAHRIFAAALESLLNRSGHEVVGCVADLDAAVELTRREQADACVLDVGLAASGRSCALQDAMADLPKTAFVVLADSPDSSGFAATLAAGVHGAALKTDEVRGKLIPTGIEPAGGSVADFVSFTKIERQRLSDLAAKIKVNKEK